MSERDNTAIVQKLTATSRLVIFKVSSIRCRTVLPGQLPEVTNMPVAGKRTGRDGVKEFFATLARDQDVIEFEPPSLWRRETKSFHSVITDGG